MRSASELTKTSSRRNEITEKIHIFYCCCSAQPRNSNATTAQEKKINTQKKCFRSMSNLFIKSAWMATAVTMKKQWRLNPAMNTNTITAHFSSSFLFYLSFSLLFETEIIISIFLVSLKFRKLSTTTFLLFLFVCRILTAAFSFFLIRNFSINFVLH